MLSHTRVAFAVVVLATAVSCSKNSPTTPTPTFWTLAGTVRSNVTQAGIAGVRLDIQDGPNQGHGAVTNAAGQYLISQLRESGFTLRATHADFVVRSSQGVSLTSHSTLDFTLERILRGDLVWEGVVIYYPQPPKYELWDFNGHGRNRGDGCAGSISGTIQLVDGLGRDVPGSIRTFSVPASTVVRPTERFDYRGCCFTTAELDQTTAFRTAFTWENVTCP